MKKMEKFDEKNKNLMKKMKNFENQNQKIIVFFEMKILTRGDAGGVEETGGCLSQ